MHSSFFLKFLKKNYQHQRLSNNSKHVQNCHHVFFILRKYNYFSIVIKNNLHRISLIFSKIINSKFFLLVSQIPLMRWRDIVIDWRLKLNRLRILCLTHIQCSKLKRSSLIGWSRLKKCWEFRLSLKKNWQDLLLIKLMKWKKEICVFYFNFLKT